MTCKTTFTKTIPFGGAHTYIPYIGEYHPRGVVFKALFVCLTISQKYVLPDYLLSMRNGNQDRNYLIKEYFRLGFNHTEILSFLALYHGVRLSLRRLERILVSQGLRRKKIQSRIERVAIVKQTNNALNTTPVIFAVN